MKITLLSWRRLRSQRLVRPRSGLMIIAALVCLLIVTSIVCSMLQGAMRARRQLHVERDRRQAELLLAAGADRAASKLAADANFRGDTWTVSADAIIGQGDGRVTTTVLPSDEHDGWRLDVVAEYPLGRSFPIRRSHVFPIAPINVDAQE